MCVILYKKQAIELSLDTLKLIVDRNPDGLGYAINKGNYWSVKKYLKPSIKDLKNIVKQCEGCEAVIHARIATSGGVTLENCQPINDSKTILFHNGIISSLNGISDTQSDTALLFEMLKSSKIDRDKLLKKLADKSTSKFVLIDQNSVALYGNWSDYKGLKASNLLFVPIAPQKHKTTNLWGGYSGLDPVSYIPRKIYNALTRYYSLKLVDLEDLALDAFDAIDWDAVFSVDFVNDWLSDNTKYQVPINSYIEE